LRLSLFPGYRWPWRYKAAYYNPTTSSYYIYSTSSNSQPSNVLSATGTNNANYYNGGFTDPTNYLTAVGAFADSVSPYVTYDQDGELFQWNESVYQGAYRGIRGGAFDFSQITYMQSSSGPSTEPTSLENYIGFRIAQVPEPGSTALLCTVAIGMLSRSGRIRRTFGRASAGQ
jgi:hypothetical protein